MRTHAFLPPRSLTGIVAILAISIAVAGTSAHDHAADDGAEAHSQVCVLAGTAVVPASDACASIAKIPPLVPLELATALTAAVSEADRRLPRARGPPAHEFDAI